MAVEYRLNMEVTCDTCSQKYFFELHAGTGSFLDQEVDACQELADLEIERGWKLIGSPYGGWETICPSCLKGKAKHETA